MTEDNVTTVAGFTAISKQLLDQHMDINKTLLAMMQRRPNPEQVAAQRAERERDWDIGTAEGRVAISDLGDYECGPEWEECQRGDHIERWVSRAAWARYTAAVQEMNEAEAAL